MLCMESYQDFPFIFNSLATILYYSAGGTGTGNKAGFFGVALDQDVFYEF